MSTETLIGKYPLEKRKILKKTIQWISRIAVPVVFFLGFFFVVASEIIGLMGTLFSALFLFIGLSVAIYLYQMQYFRNYFYDLVGGELVVRKGVFSTKQTNVPLSKIQDVYLDQDLFDRVFGLWDLHISSASETSGFEAHIDGVNEVNGRTMYGILLGKTVSVKEKATVGEVYLPSKSGLVIMGVKSFSWLVFGLFVPFLLPLFILVFLGSLVLNFFEFNSIRYELRDDGVFIKRGFISPKESLVLYRNIQDVEETQNLGEIILGIKTLSVKTMTRLSALDSNIRFLPPDIAERLREEILGLSRKISRAEMEPPGEEISHEAEAEAAETLPPYSNHFMKSMIYSHIINVGIMALVITLISLFLGVFASTTFLFGVLVAVGIFVILFISAAINALILSMTYSYSVSSELISVKVGLLNIRRKQINYNKIQDLEVNITFPQSFAGLASLKLETGSKELIQHKNSTTTVSVSKLVESVPDLYYMNAVKLNNRIAGLMGISLQGIGVDTLVSRFPLETIKPLKKTLWWVIYLTPVVVLACVASYLSNISVFAILVIIPSFILILLGKYVYEYYYYMRYFYDLNDQVLVVRKGVFGSRELTIPFSKIQDVFIDQDILDRLFNLRDLYVSTVTGRSILNAHIDGISPEKTEKIALMILDRMHGDVNS